MGTGTKLLAAIGLLYLIIYHPFITFTFIIGAPLLVLLAAVVALLVI